MRDIPINNPDVLDALNNFLWYYENRDIVARNLKLHGEAKDRKYFMSEKYRDEIIAQDTAHEGFPDAGHSYALKADRLHHIEGRESNPEAFTNILKRMIEAAGRGMWNPDEETLDRLKSMYSDMDSLMEGINTSS